MISEKEILAALDVISEAFYEKLLEGRWYVVAKAALEAAEEVKDCKDCPNYGGMEADLNAVLESIEKAESLQSLREITKLNYPEGRSTVCKHGWQPIETAPKDGTEILLYFPIYWNGNKPQIKSAAFDAADNIWIDNIMNWCKEDSPTKWQPLPPTEGVK